MGLNNNACKSLGLLLRSERRRSGERMNYRARLMSDSLPHVWKIWTFGKVRHVGAEGGQRSQLASRAQGHLTADHVELTHACTHGCQEKAVSVLPEPLGLPFKLILMLFPFFFFSLPGYNARPTENKYNSIAKGIPRT